MNIEQLSPPAALVEQFRLMGGKLTGLFLVNHVLQVMVGELEGKIQMTVAHPRRDPTLDEIAAVRYAVLPAELTFGIVYPPFPEWERPQPKSVHLAEIPRSSRDAVAERRIIMPGEF